MRVKDFGQVFTPDSIVKDILDASDYIGENILEKHVIDNSCGDGAFLIEIIKRYIYEYNKKNDSLKNIEYDLEKYIHGIEMDNEIYNMCINNLYMLLDQYEIKHIKFDILNEDALKVSKYNNKMDFVLGNPPYVRVHNLNEQYNNVKRYSFCGSGMTDLYIVFYEIGLRMLNENGILCYISPNSFYNSLAGRRLREYIKEQQNVELLMDLGHYQPFNVTTYTTICKIVNGSKFGFCKYYKYNIETGIPEFISNIKYNELFIDNNIILSSNNKKIFKYFSYNLNNKLEVQVKNGFATLNDKIFIQDNFSFNDNIIDVLKASTGQWKKCIYPYDKKGKLISFNNLNKEVQLYLEHHKKDLVKENKKVDLDWYAFGRSQAINDVKLNKIAINNCIKDITSIKLNKVNSNKGLYSGLYMLTEIPFKKIKEEICSQKFIEYLRLLNKCKSGGYYTFSSKDLEKYINCCLEENKNE